MTEDEQMALALVGEDIKPIDTTELRYNYTGERFLRDHPDRAALAIKLIALGFSNKAIEAKVHCEHRVVRELRYRCITEINEQKAELRKIIFPGVALSAEKALELLETCKNSKDAAITHGILRDSYMLLSGQPTSIVDMTARVDIAGQMRNLLAEAEEKMKMAIAHVVEPGEPLSLGPNEPF
jgi:hypothetical protein